MTTIGQRLEEKCACTPWATCLLHYGEQKVTRPYGARDDDDPRPAHVRRERTRRR